MSKITDKIERKIGVPEIVERLANNTSGSELNSLLLEIFRLKSKKIAPSELLNNFQNNRFTVQSVVNPVVFKELEIMWLKAAEEAGFKAVQLSPLAPFGTISAVTAVGQNNIVSSVRGTEIVSDATNVLALIIADEAKKGNKPGTVKYCTTHRHVRAQYFTNPMFSAHFGLFCMATGGRDTGGHTFELENFKEHLEFYIRELSAVFEKKDLIIKIEFKDDNRTFTNKVRAYLEYYRDIRIEYVKNDENNSYYKLLRFKVFIKHKDGELDLCDGGFVDWTQKLLENKKQRLIISGTGLELIYKLSMETI